MQYNKLYMSLYILTYGSKIWAVKVTESKNWSSRDENFAERSRLHKEAPNKKYYIYGRTEHF
jgi:hypothetical protein